MPWALAAGAAISAGGSLLAGDQARAEAYKGYHYLKEESPVGSQYVPAGGRANAAIESLLGVNGDPTAFNNAFANYRDSTGYNFQLGEGQRAITTNAAARGLLNSGGYAKAITKYGQNLAATTFDNYLAKLGGLSTQGLQGADAIGRAGTEGGQTAASAKYDSTNNAFGALGGVIKGLF